jgi:type II secretory pathway pseudopilin PulG
MNRPAAFALVELLAGLLVLTVLPTLMVPALARTRLDTKSFQCMNNARQIAAAIHTYAADHQDLLVPNPDDGTSVQGHNWCAGLAGTGDLAEFNPDLLKSASSTLMAPYLRNEVALFHCPADARLGRYTGSEPGKVDTIVRSARSISLNAAVETTCAGFDASTGHSGAPRLSVNGPWLDNAHAHRRDNPYKTFGKLTSFTVVSPAGIWLTMDEDPYSINDGNFALGMNTAEWIDLPGSAHDFAAKLSFGDGHVELHRWLDSRTLVVNGIVTRRPVPNSVDWAWLAARTSFRAQ